MQRWLKEALETNKGAWLTMIVIAILIGGPGMERIFYRIFPTEEAVRAKAADNTLSGQVGVMSERTYTQLKEVLKNQTEIITVLGGVARAVNTAQLEQLRMDMRVTALERATLKSLEETEPKSQADKLP